MASFMIYGFVLIYLRDFAPGKEAWIESYNTGAHFEARLAHVHGNLFSPAQYRLRLFADETAFEGKPCKMGILAGSGWTAHAARHFGRSISGLAILPGAGRRAFHFRRDCFAGRGGCSNEERN